MNYEQIKAYYDNGFWTKKMVRKTVEKGIITPIQYKSITGEVY